MKRKPGITLVELVVVVGIMTIMFSLLIPAVQSAREAGRRLVCSDRLRQLALATHSFEAQSNRLPAGNEGPDGLHPYETWMVKLLPHLEQNHLYHEIQKAYEASKNPFNHNIHSRFDSAQVAFSCPSDPRVSESQVARGIPVALTSFVGVNGTNFRLKDGVFFFQSKVRFAEVTDGLSNTISIVERPPSSDHYFGWWYAGYASSAIGSPDSTVGASDLNAMDSAHVGAFCPTGPYKMQKRAVALEQCGIFHPWSLHSVVHSARADGSVCALAYEMSPDVLISLSTRAGSELSLD